MKILVLTNLYPPHYVGGYELRCAAITEAMRLRGHEVQVLTSNHGLPDGPQAADPHVERSLRIHGYYGHPWLGLNALRKLELHNNHTLRQALDTVGAFTGPLLAIGVALNILREGAHLAWRSVDGLMDKAVEPEVPAGTRAPRPSLPCRATARHAPRGM